MRSVLVAGLVAAMAIGAHAATPLPTHGATSVYDAGDVIDASTEASLEQLDSELLAKTGVAMVVVTVPKLVDETIDQLAVRVQHDWGVGTKGKDESVVIALSLADRKIFIATGYGSEGYLPDGKVGELRDHATPQLKANAYGAGILQIAREAAGIAAAEHKVALDDSVRAIAPQPHERGSILPMVLFFIVFAVFAIFGSRRGGGGGGGGGGFLAGAVLGSMFNNGGRGGDSGGGGFGGFGGGSGGGGGAGGSF